MKPSSLIVEIHHHTGVDAANAIKVKHRGLIDFNAFQGSTLNHENIPAALATPRLVDNLAERARKLAKMR